EPPALPPAEPPALPPAEPPAVPPAEPPPLPPAAPPPAPPAVPPSACAQTWAMQTKPSTQSASFVHANFRSSTLVPQSHAASVNPQTRRIRAVNAPSIGQQGRLRSSGTRLRGTIS